MQDALDCVCVRCGCLRFGACGVGMRDGQMVPVNSAFIGSGDILRWEIASAIERRFIRTRGAFPTLRPTESRSEIQNVHAVPMA